MKQKSLSYAIFGSQARGDQDEISDNDILVVSESERIGYNWARTNLPDTSGISVYTWRRLRSMSSLGSLFVQHLKQEARICVDPDNRLRELLEGYSPAGAYQDEIVRTSKFLELLGRVPADGPGVGWALDLLAVVGRNVAIARIANQGEYVFSWTRVADALHEQGILDQEDVEVLLSLRRMKNQYRANGEINTSELVLRRNVEMVSRICGNRYEVNLIPRREIPIFELGVAFNAYSRCRIIERDLPGLVPKGAEYSDEFCSLLNEMRRYVLNPRAYLWKFAEKGTGNQIKRLERLREICRHA